MPQRPPSFVVLGSDSAASQQHPYTSATDAFSNRQESMLMPGEVRTPAVRPTPLLGDWTRGDSTVWDVKDEASAGNGVGSGHPLECTPLNSYGRENLWQISAAEDHQMQERQDSHMSLGSGGGHEDDDVDVDAVRQTISQALAASQEAVAATSSRHHNAFAGGQRSNVGSYTAQSQSYTQHQQQYRGRGTDVDDHYPGTYTVSSGPASQHPAHLHHQHSSHQANRFTVQHAMDPHATRGDALLSREASTQEFSAITMATAGGAGNGGLSRQSSTDSNALLAKFRSQSEILSDELYFQAKTFPPPPPSNSPMETRRVRAELWYLIARKWDITQQMPPPPRSPLPGMEEEHRLRLQELTRVPYRGDRWLSQSEHWFDWVQRHFVYPEENVANVLPPSFVMQMCA